MENTWSILPTHVYENSTQYDSIDDLKEVVKYEWERKEISTLKKLTHSMVN